MSEDSVHEPIENMAEMKEALQRFGFLARERAIDDELDSETWTALYLFAESRGLAWPLEDFEAEDGTIPPVVGAALLDPMAAMSFCSVIDEDGDLLILDDEPGEPPEIDLTAVEVFDYRNDHELNEKKARRTPRKPEQIDMIVLHQTGIKFGVGSRAAAKYGERVALHRRFWDVACHVAALMNGDVLIINPWERYVFHGHGSNRRSIGIEIEGLYAGIADNPKTVAGKNEPNELSKRSIAAARKAVEVAVEQCRALGMPITKIAAHRQYHSSRISDPGEAIWREVALWAVEALELAVDYDFAAQNRKVPRKSGFKIPRDWDPQGTVDYRGRPLD